MYLPLICFICFWECVYTRPADERKLQSSLKTEFPNDNMINRRDRLAKLSFSVAAPKPLGDKPSPVIANNNNAAVDPDFSGIVGTNQDSGISDYLFQGDMHLTENQLKYMEDHSATESGSRSKRQVALEANRWTNGTVYYYFDDGLAKYMIDIVVIAIQYYEENTCIRFQYSRTAVNRIKIFNGTGCYSLVGMFGGEQPLSLGIGCNTVATAYHELMHALCYMHTQSRTDRDQYLRVDLSRVQPNMTNNFYKFGANEMKMFTPFEYGSAMEYPVDAFTTDGSYSMNPRDQRYVYTMGSDIVTYYDTIMVNKYYCTDTPKSPACAVCRNGGECNPNDCRKCICPNGYSGVLCDQRPNGCGSELIATDSWQSVTVKMGTIGILAPVFSYCNYFIKAPVDKYPQVRITFMPDGPRQRCFLGCIANGIEFKTEDSKMTNIRCCCKNDTATYETRTSKLNPMPVIVYNRRDDFPVTFEYKCA